MKQRDVIQQEAHALANTLLGRNDLPRVLETRQLWEETETTSVDDMDEADDEPTVLPQRAEGESC